MRKKCNLWLATIFVLIMTSLYISFLFFSDQIPLSKVEYAGIIVCFIFSVSVLVGKVDTWLVRFAFLFTLISDWFLVIRKDNFDIALMTFTIAQLFYAIRIWFDDNNKNRNWKHIYLRIILLIVLECGALIVTKKLNINYDIVLFLALLYSSLLLTNVILSFTQIKKNVLFPLGMLLFLGCDIVVGLSRFQDYLTLSQNFFVFKILNFPIDLVWLFYFPSQTLLALSILSHEVNSLSK